MDLLDHFRRLHAYDDWANLAVLSALKGLADPPPKAVRLFAHVLAARRIWLDRLSGDRPGIERLPDWSLAESERRFESLRPSWRDYLLGLSSDGLSRAVSYTSMTGEPWTDTVADILTHVVTHSHYHRGQIAAELGARGHQPPMTDFIFAVRRGLTLV